MCQSGSGLSFKPARRKVARHVSIWKRIVAKANAPSVCVRVRVRARARVCMYTHVYIYLYIYL